MIFNHSFKLRSLFVVVCVSFCLVSCKDREECEDLCDKFVPCTESLGVDPGMSADSCADSCMDEEWHDIECGECWLECDTSLDCSDFIMCMYDCPCSGFSTGITDATKVHQQKMSKCIEAISIPK